MVGCRDEESLKIECVGNCKRNPGLKIVYQTSWPSQASPSITYILLCSLPCFVSRLTKQQNLNSLDQKYPASTSFLPPLTVSTFISHLWVLNESLNLVCRAGMENQPSTMGITLQRPSGFSCRLHSLQDKCNPPGQRRSITALPSPFMSHSLFPLVRWPAPRVGVAV